MIVSEIKSSTELRHLLTIELWTSKRDPYHAGDFIVDRTSVPPPAPAPEEDVTADELIEFNCQALIEDDDDNIDITFEEGTGNIHRANAATQATSDTAKSQMMKKKMSVGFHHGRLTTLPRTMKDYPEMNLQQYMC